MLDVIVRYLHEENVPFRLISYGSEEGEPPVAHPVPAHGVLVDARFVIVDGRLVLACYRHGEHVDLSAIGNELGGTAMDALPDELPEELVGLEGAIPPLGQLFGAPLIVDEMVEGFATIVFRGFGHSAWFEVPYDDFARQEAPRVASFARAGALEPARKPGAGAARPGA